MAGFIDDTSLIECSLCNEPYGEDREPKLLPCRHVFCTGCLEQWHDQKPGSIECPECRKEHRVPEGGVKNLPNDLTMTRFVEQHNTRQVRRKNSDPKKMHPSCQADGSFEASHLPGASREEKIHDLLANLHVSVKDVTSSGKIFDEAIDRISMQRISLHETLQTEKAAINTAARAFARAASTREKQLLLELTKSYEANLALLTAQFDDYATKKKEHEGFCRELEDHQQTPENLRRLIQKAQSKNGSLPNSVQVISRNMHFKNDRYQAIIADISSWGTLKLDHNTLEVSLSGSRRMEPSLSTADGDQASLNHYVAKEEAIRCYGCETNATLSSPSCVVELPNKEIAVGTKMSYAINIFSSPEQKTLSKLFVGANTTFEEGITGMCLDHSNNILVSSPDQLEIQVLNSRHNELIMVWESEFKFFSCEISARGLAVSRSGCIYVCDGHNHTIKVFDHNGTLQKSIGRRGRDNGMLHSPTDIALTPSEDLVVTDFNNNRIQVFNQNGDFLWTFGTPGSGIGQLKGPIGIAIDSKGFMAVSELYNNRVQIFTPHGKAFKIIGEKQLDTPRGICITQDREIVVCDSKNDRVLVY